MYGPHTEERARIDGEKDASKRGFDEAAGNFNTTLAGWRGLGGDGHHPGHVGADPFFDGPANEDSYHSEG